MTVTCLGVFQLPDVKEKLIAMEFDVVATTPEQFRGWIQSEIVKWGKVIKSTGAKAD